MSILIDSDQMKQDIKQDLFCPECDSTSLRRSQRKGILERFFLYPLGFRAYRCQDCYNRFVSRFKGQFVPIE
jgi:ribosomal protein L37AE/L43A